MDNDDDNSLSSFKTSVEVFSDRCLILRNGLTLQEQIELYKELQSRDRTIPFLADNPRMHLMKELTLLHQQGDGNYNKGNDVNVATTRKEVDLTKKASQVIFDNQSPFLDFTYSDDDSSSSLYNRLVEKVKGQLLSSSSLSNNDETYLLSKMQQGYSLLTLSALVYPYPNGNLARHIDNDDSLVFLFSLGATAQYVVQTPNMKDEEQVFPCRSGDVLVFDASREAAVTHGVLGVLMMDDTTNNKNSYPPHPQLTAAFDQLKTNRVGVQCRIRKQ